MHLRPRLIRTSGAAGQPAGLRLAAALLGAFLILLVPFAGRAEGGASDYPSPLYLDGGASSIGSGSFVLRSTSPAATPSTPTLADSGTAGNPNGTYSYVVVAKTGGVQSASNPSAGLGVTSKQITVSNLPGSAVDIYRAKSLTVQYRLVASDVVTATYTDNMSDAAWGSQPILPYASTLVGLFATGYFAFAPGNTLLFGTNNTADGSGTPASSSKGWVVDGPGSVSILAGDWTFQARIKSGAQLNGVAHLVVGMWVVDSAGNILRTVIDPSQAASENSATNLITSTSQINNRTVTVTSVGAVSLAASEHLYVQLYRRQTTSSSSGSSDGRQLGLLGWDANNSITHPAASTFPNDPTLQTPADAARTNSSALVATFNDPDAGDTGTVDFRVCSAAAAAGSQCAPLVASGSVSGVTAGANASWTVSPALADGTYYWQAHATDAADGQSGWTATRSFTLDTTQPSTPTLQSPANGALKTSLPQLSASFSDPDAGDTGVVDFQICSDSGCATVVASGSSSTVSTGSAGSWTPGSLADGSYYWQARGQDTAGNQSGWTSSRSFTLDTIPPDTTISASPANPSNTSAASFSLSSTEAGSSFQCQLDGGDYGACTSPQSSAGLADGSHTFQVKATDPVGNTDASPASFTWTVDTIPPETTITASPADPSATSAASFEFSATEAGSSFQCQLDGGGYGACTSPQSYAGLTDGSHTFQVKATDPAGNTDASPASSTWTVDTIPPARPELTRPGDGARTNSLRLAARFPRQLAAMFDDPNPRDTGTATFRVCADPECATVLATGSSSLIRSGATASLTIDAALGEGTYYWQARAQDVAGNRSGWTAIRSFTLDTTPPDPPASFSGTAGAAVLTLYWAPPAAEDSVGNYLLYIDGVRSAVLTGATLQARLGKFDADDPRSFAVAVIDAAGNEGPRSETLVGVPDLVGLRISEAGAALAARALVFGKQAQGIAQGSGSGLITSQQPAAGTLAPRQGAVFVALSSPSGRTRGGAGRAPSAPLVVLVAGSRTVSCAPSGHLSLQITLTGTAQVAARFLTLQGVPLNSRQLGSVQAGTKTVRVRIPSSLEPRQRYRLIVTAMTQSQIGRAELRLDLSKVRVSLGAWSDGCRAARSSRG